MTAAKAEMIQKTALDLVTVLNIMHHAEANTDNDWDIAAGYFYGKSGKSDYTIYGRAEKRCANYGTCTGSGGEAMVNTAIGQALRWERLRKAQEVHPGALLPERAQIRQQD